MTDGKRVQHARPRGEEHKNAKLTEEKVRLLRQLRGDGLTVTEVAAFLGVGRMTVSDAERGRSWGHVA